MDRAGASIPPLALAVALQALAGCSLPDFDAQIHTLPEGAAAPPRLEGCDADADCKGFAPEGEAPWRCVKLRPDDDGGVCASAAVVRETVGGDGGEGEGEGGAEGEGEGGGCVAELERCDGRDNDCDQATDEGFDVGGPCDAQGICRGGSWACDGVGGRVCSAAPGQPGSRATEEVCNRRDDDCDGEVDEGLVLTEGDEELAVGARCAAAGRCGGGFVVCGLPGTPLQGRPCCSSDPECAGEAPGNERCDGIDNDCDGDTDEGFGVGETCAGEPACGEGARVCAADELSACCSTAAGCEPRAPGVGPVGEPEKCDGVDNDCDGLTDEDWAELGADCGQGACVGGSLACDAADPARASLSCDSAGRTSVERCNEIDDDCDGATDEGIAGLGDRCGQGACAGGVLRCDLADRAGVRQVCSTAALAGVETCNGLDDDCDGQVDEGLGVGAPCAGVGQCPAGRTECNGGGGLRCSSHPGGSHYAGVAELCNGLDDDCDGRVPADEGDADLDGVRSCDEAGHVPACPAGAPADPAVGPGLPELCDDVDNDCDGQADEGLGLGDDCGAGRCMGGDLVCDPEDPTHRSVVCNTRDRARPEVCNGIDDDCDGALPVWDQDADGDGERPCDGDCDDDDRLVNSVAPERCNGRDDDCDGVVPVAERDRDGDGYVVCASDDPGLKGGDCDDDRADVHPGAFEACDGVNTSCNPAYDAARAESDVDVDGYRACAECNDRRPDIRPGIAERCGDGVDNDCDGLPDATDDDLEACDGFDNDCDGLADEDWPVATNGRQAAGCQGDAGACSLFFGRFECAPDDPVKAVRCSVEPGGSQDASNDEVCNGEDDDCDGETDEGCDDDADGWCDIDMEVEGGADCEPGDCDDLRPATNPGAQQELCDGLDNDCDGALDPAEADEDGDGFRACDGLLPDCDDTLPDVHPGAFEACDGLDSDCSDGGRPPDAEAADADGDGVTACFDCDEADPEVPREDRYEDLGNGKDDDCDGVPDGLDDDFEDGALPASWTVLRGDATEAGGALALTRDAIPGALVQALAPALVAPQGFDVEVTASIPDERSNTFAGIVFGWTRDGTFAYAALHPPNQLWLGTFTNNIADPVLGRFDRGLRNRGFGPVKLRVRGDGAGGVRVSADGVEVVTGRGLPAGRIGLFGKDARVVFDDLRIRRP